MSEPLKLEPVHHIRLTVTDVQQSQSFYTDVLGFEMAMAGPPATDDPYYPMAVQNLQGGVVLTNGQMLLGLRPTDHAHQTSGDRFDPFRVGLDHLSFRVSDRSQLVKASGILDNHNVEHGEITDLPIFGISVLSLRDPDGIQLELTAPFPG